jgi:hypothetical protein
MGDNMDRIAGMTVDQWEAECAKLAAGTRTGYVAPENEKIAANTPHADDVVLEIE